MRSVKLVTVALFVVIVSGCAQTAPPLTAAPQQITVQCPANSTCDVNVTPPSMQPQEIQYALDNPTTTRLTEDVLVALMIQDMTWRNCWDCYSGYYNRYPSLYSQRNYYYGMPLAQRVTQVQQNNYTVIQNNTTVIQAASAAVPPAVKAAPVTTSGKSTGTGGGNAATNKSSGVPAPAAPANATKPSAPSQPAPARTTGRHQ